MYRLLGCYFLVGAGMVAGLDSNVASTLQGQLQAIIDAKGPYWNVSIAVGFKQGDITVAAAGGPDTAKATTESLFPSGSVTKPFTTAGIFQLIGEGKFELDSLMAPLVNPALEAWNGSSIESLFGQNSFMEKVTLRHLLSMRSGLQDYDDNNLMQWTYAYPDRDYSPFDFIASTNKTALFEPGTGGSYSSVGFEFLGLILAWHSGTTSNWYDYNQLSVLPDAERPFYNEQIHFAMNGPCSLDPRIVDQYAWYRVPGEESLHFFDIDRMSCLNGWTCGNIAPTPLGVASYFYDLFNGKIIPMKDVALMRQWNPLTTGWCEGCAYGMGLFPENYFESEGLGFINDTITLGHGGMDYGSGAAPTGYNTKYDFGFSVAIGGATGSNCSFDDVQMNGNAWQDTVCPMYDAVMQAASGGKATRLNCTWTVANGIDYGFGSSNTGAGSAAAGNSAVNVSMHVDGVLQDNSPAEYTNRGPWRRFRATVEDDGEQANAAANAIKCNYTFPHFAMGDDLKPLPAPVPALHP